MKKVEVNPADVQEQPEVKPVSLADVKPGHGTKMVEVPTPDREAK